MRPLFSFLLLLCLIPFGISTNKTSTLTVEVIGARSDKGTIAICLFNHPDGFPGSAEKALKRAQVTIKGGKATCTFSGLPYGTYAVGILHDEDNNGKVATNFLGIPTEGTGASNDARGTMGPPRFTDAQFEVKALNTTIQVRVKYY